jgi:pimeloyl-ACP methyl ester carboxylesterase
MSALTSQPGTSAGVRRLSLPAGDITLSALLAEPAHAGPSHAGSSDAGPRATVVALHGSGMSAGYFDGQAHPDLSLLALGARLGYTVLALDRPGYGESAARLPDGAPLANQAALVTAALRAFAAGHQTGAGLFVLAHSHGGKLALTVAADAPRRAGGGGRLARAVPRRRGQGHDGGPFHVRGT